MELVSSFVALRSPMPPVRKRLLLAARLLLKRLREEATRDWVLT